MVRKTREGTHTSANLINVPAPGNGNTKRFLTVETILETRKEPEKLRTSFRVLQCGFSGTLLLHCRWQCSNNR